MTEHLIYRIHYLLSIIICNCEIAYSPICISVFEICVCDYRLSLECFGVKSAVGFGGNYPCDSFLCLDFLSVYGNNARNSVRVLRSFICLRLICSNCTCRRFNGSGFGLFILYAVYKLKTHKLWQGHCVSFNRSFGCGFGSLRLNRRLCLRLFIVILLFNKINRAYGNCRNKDNCDNWNYRLFCLFRKLFISLRSFVLCNFNAYRVVAHSLFPDKRKNFFAGNSD